jgi:hypothetical protein
LDDLAGFNEDSLFFEFAENACRVVIPAPKCHGEEALPHSKELKSNSQGRVARQNSLASKSPLFSASEQP